MAIKKISITITKFYLLSWIFGLIAIWCCYYRHYIWMLLPLYFSYSYSVSDYRNPPSANMNDDSTPSSHDDSDLI